MYQFTKRIPTYDEYIILNFAFQNFRYKIQDLHIFVYLCSFQTIINACKQCNVSNYALKCDHKETKYPIQSSSNLQKDLLRHKSISYKM